MNKERVVKAFTNAIIDATDLVVNLVEDNGDVRLKKALVSLKKSTTIVKSTFGVEVYKSTGWFVYTPGDFEFKSDVEIENDGNQILYHGNPFYFSSDPVVLECMEEAASNVVARLGKFMKAYMSIMALVMSVNRIGVLK